MPQVLDWHVEADLANIRPGAIELQSALHERMYSSIFDRRESAIEWLNGGRTYWRLQTLYKLETLIETPLQGRILEIGAGVGWCSGVLSHSSAVSEVYALEYDPYCVNTLMPKVHKCLDADVEKVHYVHGSFNHIPESNAFDLIVSMGALHHSENLQQTLQACYDALRPGGYLLASEPVEQNSLSIAAERQKENKDDVHSVRKYGRPTQHKDNSDHYYRLCQYESTAYFAGFNVWPFLFDHETGTPASDAIFQNRTCYDGHQVIVHQPFFARENLYDGLMLVLQKPIL